MTDPAVFGAPPEADAAEQARSLVEDDDWAGPTPEVDVPLEADPADVVEQAIDAGLDADDDR
jgi:hypothetical protein